MDLKTWRQQNRTGEAFTLPSGLEVRLRHVSMLDLAERGDIPAPLAGLVQSLIDGGQQQQVRLNLDEFPQYAQVINLVVAATVIDPPVADTASETHLGVTELPIADRLAIFNWANEVADSLQPFRQE